MTQADDIIAAHRQVKESQLTRQEWLEAIADVQHEIWSHWMRYLFSTTTDMGHDGLAISPSNVMRWAHQMNTPYSELSEKEKDSDRDQAKKVRDALIAKSFYIE